MVALPFQRSENFRTSPYGRACNCLYCDFCGSWEHFSSNCHFVANLTLRRKVREVMNMCLYLGPEGGNHGQQMGAMLLAVVPGGIFTKIHRWAKRYLADESNVCKPLAERPDTQPFAFNAMLSLATLLWATSTQDGGPLVTLDDFRAQNEAVDRELVPLLLRLLSDNYLRTFANPNQESEIHWQGLRGLDF